MGQHWLPPPPYLGRGRRRIGKQLPSPAAVAADAATLWERVRVAWYGATHKEVELCSGSGYLVSEELGGDAHLRWGRRARAPEHGARRDKEYLTTEMGLKLQRRSWNSWSADGASRRPSRRHARSSASRHCVTGRWRRSALMCMLLGLYTLIVVWFAQHVRAPEACKRHTPWSQDDVAFSDISPPPGEMYLGRPHFPPDERESSRNRQSREHWLTLRSCRFTIYAHQETS